MGLTDIIEMAEINASKEWVGTALTSVERAILELTEDYGKTDTFKFSIQRIMNTAEYLDRSAPETSLTNGDLTDYELAVIEMVNRSLDEIEPEGTIEFTMDDVEDLMENMG